MIKRKYKVQKSIPKVTKQKQNHKISKVAKLMLNKSLNLNLHYFVLCFWISNATYNQTRSHLL